MSRLGLIMYLGKVKKKSKTEAVFFPSRTKLQSWINENEKILLLDINLTLDEIKEKRKNPFEKDENHY